MPRPRRGGTLSLENVSRCCEFVESPDRQSWTLHTDYVAVIARRRKGFESTGEKLVATGDRGNVRVLMLSILVLSIIRPASAR